MSLIFLAILGGIPTVPLLQIRKLRSRGVRRLVFLNVHKEKRMDLSYPKLNLMAVWWQVLGYCHNVPYLVPVSGDLNSIIDVASWPLWCLYLGKSTQHVQKAWWGDLIYKTIQKKKKKKETLPKKSNTFLASGIIRKQKEAFLYILKLSLKMRYCHLMEQIFVIYWNKYFSSNNYRLVLSICLSVILYSFLWIF